MKETKQKGRSKGIDPFPVENSNIPLNEWND
jgi:hypothetical protein